MKGLQDLTLACCKLSSNGVAGLSSVQGLTSLDLVGCVDGVTPEAAAALSKVRGPSVQLWSNRAITLSLLPTATMHMLVKFCWAPQNSKSVQLQGHSYATKV